MRPSIRDVRPEDASALAAIERLCPEIGRAAFRIELRVSPLDLAARYPDSRGYVALAPDGATVAGVIFSSVAPTQLDGALVPAAYLFGLRVHPDYRRRGVASALIAHACERAKQEAGADVAFANVIEGNEASLRTVDRAGFVRLRDLRATLIVGGMAMPGRLPTVIGRPAMLDDLPALAGAYNHCYAGHNFWRPRTPAQLGVELEAAGHSIQDSEVVGERPGAVIAAASALEVSRFARLRLVRLHDLPGPANWLLAPFFRRMPVNLLLVRYWAFPDGRPALGAAVVQSLCRRYLPHSWGALVVADPLDPVWPGLDRLWGITGRVHLVVRSERSVDESRPACLP